MMKKLSALFLALALVLSLAACTGGTPDGSAQPSGSAPAAEGKFTPGTYEGEAKGFGGTIKVAVTLSADRIDKVEVLESTETETIGEVALESLPQAVVDAQSSQIDTVSSATVTSTAFIEAVNAALTAAGCQKAADFINFCDAFNIPVLTLVNVRGYQASKCTEKSIAKAAGRLTYAYANASVPKVTVIVKDAFGSAYLTMGSKSIGADLVYAWKDAVIGMMDPAEAVKIMYAKEIEAAEDAVALIDEKKAQYTSLQSSALAAAKRGYVDDIIEAQETRQRVIAAFEMLFTKREDYPSKKHGTV